jgi:hypothetical protein
MRGEWNKIKILSRLAVVLIFSRFFERDLGSSVSIVSDYGLDDRVIEVRSPAEAKEFLL